MEKVRNNACICWDITYPERYTSKEKLDKFFEKNCKSWCYQLELGASGYLHFQGRFKLKVKKRLSEVSQLFENDKMHLSRTSRACQNDDFYVSKDETRMDGPWMDDMTASNVRRIPRDIEMITELRPWQKSIVEISKIFEIRHVNVLVDFDGSLGKSTLSRWMRWHKLARAIGVSDNYKDIMRMVMSMPSSPCYLIDLPRNMNKSKIKDMWSAIETVKGGDAWDDRYEYTERMFDPPVIWVFTNAVPEKNMLTLDRWKIWEVVDEELIKFDPKRLRTTQEVVDDYWNGLNFEKETVAHAYDGLDF